MSAMDRSPETACFRSTFSDQPSNPCSVNEFRLFRNPEAPSPHPAAPPSPPPPSSAPGAVCIGHVGTSVGVPLAPSAGWSQTRATKAEPRRKTIFALLPGWSLPSKRLWSLAGRSSANAEETVQPDQRRYSDSSTENCDIRDLPPNPSLQRTLPGRSPGQRR